jgi:hypothetical protein
MSSWLAEEPRRGGRPCKGRAPQRKRMRKLQCIDCGLIVYATSATAIRETGPPTCGCGGAMIVPNLRDRAAIERELLEAELIEYGRDAYNAAARVLGWGLWIEPSRDRQGGAERRRCQWQGGHCVKYPSGGLYCPEHEEAARLHSVTPAYKGRAA